jgi:hypothetical protein
MLSQKQTKKEESKRKKYVRMILTFKINILGLNNIYAHE